MLGFIKANGQHPSFSQGFFYSPTQFWSLIQRLAGYTTTPRGSLFPIGEGSYFSIGHLFNEWLIQRSQDSFVPFAVGKRCRGFDEDDWQRKPFSYRDDLHTGLHPVGDDVKQFRFADSSWPGYQNKGKTSRFPNSLSQFIALAGQHGMLHGILLKDLQTLLDIRRQGFRWGNPFSWHQRYSP